MKLIMIFKNFKNRKFCNYIINLKFLIIYAQIEKNKIIIKQINKKFKKKIKKIKNLIIRIFKKNNKDA